MFSGTWPASGMTRDGDAFERLTWGRRTIASGSSSLLSTPDASQGSRGGASDPRTPRANGHAVSLGDVAAYLPTPMTSDAKTASAADLARKSPQLRAVSLLPTPVVVDMGARKETGSGPGQRGSKGDPALPSAVLPPTPRATLGGSTTETTALLSGSTGYSTTALFDVGTTPSDASPPRPSPAVEEGDHSLPPPSPNG